MPVDVDAQGDGTPAGCLSAERLDAIASGEAPGADAPHFEACERCGNLLAEMRLANAFIRRLRSSASEPAVGAREALDEVSAPGYEIGGVLALGGQGVVYRGVQSGTGREVAIKVPHWESLRRPSARSRFRREIELTARLDHPGIVRVLGACELSDGRLGCVMEFVEGHPFDRWAREARQRGGSTRRIVEAASRVADAIAYAHQRAVMHRDIKPSNVMVTSAGVARVLDFGLAKALDESGVTYATMTGAFVGTLAFAAPEQISGGADAVDLRTDVYALGLLLYQALTGRLPYATDTPTLEMLRQIREQSPARPSSVEPEIGGELDAILLKALAKEKDRRYASAGELRDDLRAWLDGRAVRARLDSRWYVMRKFVGRHRVLAAGSLLAFIAVAAISAMALVTREQADRARIADAVSDALAIESHWVRMGEARSIAADNFEPGERLAWDALLDPDPALMEEGIEGDDSDGPARTSPAFWALWEMYLRTPILFTIPAASTVVGFDGPSGLVVGASDGNNAVEWWDWLARRRVHLLRVPLVRHIRTIQTSPTSGTIVVTDDDGALTLVDRQRGSSTPLSTERATGGVAISADLVAVTSQSAAGVAELRIWRTTPSPPVLAASLELPANASTMCFDISGRYLAVALIGGEVLVLDPETGRTLLRHRADERPRFLSVHTRGNAGEFIFHGPERVAVIHMDGDPQRDLREGFLKTGFIEDVRAIVWTTHGERYAIVSDRWRLGIARRGEPVTTGIYLPSLSTWAPSLSADGRYAAIQMRQSGRGSVLDLDSPAVRRLRFDSEVGASGFATIFAMRFSEDSRTLVAGSMDGTIRSFSTQTGEPRMVTPAPVEGGITTLLQSSDSIYIGTHDLGLRNARVLRLRGESTETILPGGERWICGMELDPGVALWALTGDGHVLMLDPNTGTIIRDARLSNHRSATSRALVRVARAGLLIAGPAGPGVLLLNDQTLEPVGAGVAMPELRAIAISPADPELIATAHDDGQIRLWRLRAGAALDLVGSLGTHAGSVFAIAFSPDGRLIASGGGTPEARDVRIWDVEHTRELAALDLFEAGVFALAFSPDGRWLAGGGEVQSGAPGEGGQLFLIDLDAPSTCIAGNLEYHIARFSEEQGREAANAQGLRAWAIRNRVGAE